MTPPQPLLFVDGLLDGAHLPARKRRDAREPRGALFVEWRETDEPAVLDIELGVFDPCPLSEEPAEIRAVDDRGHIAQAPVVPAGVSPEEALRGEQGHLGVVSEEGHPAAAAPAGDVLHAGHALGPLDAPDVLERLELDRSAQRVTGSTAQHTSRVMVDIPTRHRITPGCAGAA